LLDVELWSGLDLEVALYFFDGAVLLYLVSV